MKASDIRELSADEIRTRIGELEEERFRLKFRAATETLENPLRLRFIRRDIARLNTILREQALAAGAPRRGRKNVAAARRATATGAEAGTTTTRTTTTGSTAPTTKTKAGARKRAASPSSGAAKR